jgi:hypothetical protein
MRRWSSRWRWRPNIRGEGAGAEARSPRFARVIVAILEAVCCAILVRVGSASQDCETLSLLGGAVRAKARLERAEAGEKVRRSRSYALAPGASVA